MEEFTLEQEKQQQRNQKEREINMKTGGMCMTSKVDT